MTLSKCVAGNQPTKAVLAPEVQHEVEDEKSFRDLLKQLPKAIRVQARVSYKLFLLNPQHPGLRFKLVKNDSVVYSARVGQSYRALGYLEGDRITWFWIGSHADYEKELKTL